MQGCDGTCDGICDGICVGGQALQGLVEFENAVQFQKEIRNPAGYLVGVLKRVVAANVSNCGIA